MVFALCDQACEISAVYLNWETTKQVWYSRNMEKDSKEIIQRGEQKSIYAQGYWAGWMSYLETHQQRDAAFKALLADAHDLAEQAIYGLAPQEDYWLGYHHGRAAAKIRATRYSRSY